MGLVAQFPAPLKGMGLRPCFSPRRAFGPFRGAGNCARSPTGPALWGSKGRSPWGWERVGAAGAIQARY